MARSNDLEARNKTAGTKSRLGSGKEIKAKGSGKGGWESMKRDDEPGRIRRTSIARQALVPGKPPMHTLRSGPDLLGRRLYAWWRERSGAFQVDNLAADHFKPGSPDATVWPVTPEHWSRNRR